MSGGQATTGMAPNGSKNKEISLSNEGAIELAKIVKRARAELSYEKFRQLVNEGKSKEGRLSGMAIWNIEGMEQRAIMLSTLKALAPFTSNLKSGMPYSVQELVDICTGPARRIVVDDGARYQTAQEALHVAEQLPTPEILRLIRLLTRTVERRMAVKEALEDVASDNGVSAD